MNWDKRDKWGQGGPSDLCCCVADATLLENGTNLGNRFDYWDKIEKIRCADYNIYRVNG